MNSIVEKFNKFDVGSMKYKYDTRFILYIIHMSYGNKGIREFKKILTDEEILFLSEVSFIQEPLFGHKSSLEYLLMSDEEYMVMEIIE